MNLLLRLFARYAGRLGYLDGKRNFPGTEHFLEVPLFGVDSVEPVLADASEPLQISEPAALKEQR